MLRGNPDAQIIVLRTPRNMTGFLHEEWINKQIAEKHIAETTASVEEKENKTESHTLKNTPEYRSWSALKNRCYNKNNEYYKYYGGRGIPVCDRWKNSFISF